MPNLLALPHTLGNANRSHGSANVLGDGVAFYEGLPRRMEQIADELKKRSRVSKRALSLAAEQSKEFVNTIINGRSTDPGAVSLARMCETYGYNVRWLLTGLGPKVLNPADDARAALERDDPTPKDGLMGIPKPAESRPRPKPTKRGRE